MHCLYFIAYNLRACAGENYVNVKVEPLLTFTLTPGLSYIASISFTHVTITSQWKSTLRGSSISAAVCNSNVISRNELPEAGGAEEGAYRITTAKTYTFHKP